MTNEDRVLTAMLDQTRREWWATDTSAAVAIYAEHTLGLELTEEACVRIATAIRELVAQEARVTFFNTIESVGWSWDRDDARPLTTIADELLDASPDVTRGSPEWAEIHHHLVTAADAVVRGLDDRCRAHVREADLLLTKLVMS